MRRRLGCRYLTSTYAMRFIRAVQGVDPSGRGYLQAASTPKHYAGSVAGSPTRSNGPHGPAGLNHRPHITQSSPFHVPYRRTDQRTHTHGWRPRYNLDSWHGMDRYHYNAKINKRDWADTYSQPFQAAVVGANASGLMCSYNASPGFLKAHLLAYAADATDAPPPHTRQDFAVAAGHHSGRLPVNRSANLCGPAAAEWPRAHGRS